MSSKVKRPSRHNPGVKKDKSNDKWFLPTIIVLVILVVGTVGVMAYINSGAINGSLEAMKINGKSVSVFEANYYMRNTLETLRQSWSQYGMDDETMGLDVTKSLREQTSSYGQGSWHDYLLSEATKTIQQTYGFCAKAEAAGFNPKDEIAERVNEAVENLKASAKSQDVSVNAYLSSFYGKGSSLNAFKKVLERYTLAMLYSTELGESLKYTDDQVEKYYNENKDTIDAVTYRAYFVDGSVDADLAKDSGLSEEDTKAVEETAKKEAKKKADEMLSKLTGESNFNALAIEYSLEDQKATYENDPNATLFKDKSKSMISDTALGDWLLASERKAGDKTVVESTNGYYVALFLSRARPDYNTINVRHILFLYGNESGAEVTDEQKAAAKGKADQALADWKSGAATEDSFSELATAKSEDTGSKENGGLYTSVYKGEMTPEFDAWCFDPSRKVGDTGIVSTTYGYHVMYFSAFGGPYWKAQAENAMRTADNTKTLEDLIKEYPATQNQGNAAKVGW